MAATKTTRIVRPTSSTLRLERARSSTSASTSTRRPTTSPSSATAAGSSPPGSSRPAPSCSLERLQADPRAGRPGRLRGRADRLRPGPPPPGRGLPRRGHRPLEDARRCRPGDQERPPRLPPAGHLRPEGPAHAGPRPHRAGGGRPPGAAAPRAAGPQGPLDPAADQGVPPAARHRRAGGPGPLGGRGGRGARAARSSCRSCGSAWTCCSTSWSTPGSRSAASPSGSTSWRGPSGTGRRSATLRTVPGVGPVTAMTFRTELPEPETIGTAARWPESARAARPGRSSP